MLAGLFVAFAMASGVQPISVHPSNPRYFMFRAKPTILITSAEHYGSVINLGFDYQPYLRELSARKFNYTRVFAGTYCEDPRSFNIRDNTLAPSSGLYRCPWARSTQPGYANGGPKFDLHEWDGAYFHRLKSFCAEAGKRGIVVEISLFCPFYEESMWRLSPMNASNNVNGVGACPREEVYALKHADLTAAQDAVTRKIVRETAEFDNVIYEICNEPYFGGVTPAWQRHISETISDEEKRTGVRHLIAQNIANGSQKVTDADPNVSILNFHYASPPAAAAENAGLGRVIGFDETGFKGSADLPYRTEGWDFLMAGGGLYNNLDYSFTVAHPDGTAAVSPPTPGGGGPDLRAQLSTLQRFFAGLDFVKMAPANDLIVGRSPYVVAARVLAEPGRCYALYIRSAGAKSITLELPAGRYALKWLHPKTGLAERTRTEAHAGGGLRLAIPPYEEDIALRLDRR